jgi:transposase
MPGRLKLELNELQKAELKELLDHSPKAYIRERAAALLKIAGGLSGREVALHRLNQAHWQDTIYEWVQRYQAEGSKGLWIKGKRGRKPAFSP